MNASKLGNTIGSEAMGPNLFLAVLLHSLCLRETSQGTIHAIVQSEVLAMFDME
jgi:hypothetical protein